MDELLELCARILGDRDAAGPVTEAARLQGGADRLQCLASAVEHCHALRRDSGSAGEAPAAAHAEPTLSAAVAAELAAATARLPSRQREALALRDLLGLDHAQIGAVLAIDPAAVAALLARSRLCLRAELRGAPVAGSDCAHRDRMLRVATLRHDHESVSTQDDDWLLDHLGDCDDCVRAHAAMLEGSACYRGWRIDSDSAPSSAIATS